MTDLWLAGILLDLLLVYLTFLLLRPRHEVRQLTKNFVLPSKKTSLL